MTYSTARPRYEGPCIECGAPQTRARKLCSPCYQRAYRRLPRVTIPPRPCDYCGKMIEKPQRANARYCSRRCSYRWRNRFYLYGIGHEEVAELLARQGGKCAICGSPEPRSKRNVWHVDHDHETQEIRGILCHYCNLGIGYLGDSVDHARAAVSYLEAHAQRVARGDGLTAAPRLIGAAPVRV